MGEIRPVKRSTSNPPPRYHCHRGVESSARRSLHAKHTADCEQPFGDLVSRTGDQLECTSAAKAAFFNARFIAARQRCATSERLVGLEYPCLAITARHGARRFILRFIFCFGIRFLCMTAEKAE